MAKGFSQFEGVDFSEIFSHLEKLTSNRLLLSLVVAFDMKIEQMDLKTTFLHGDLEEEIYMKQPEGFITKGKEELDYKLKKTIFGLKQSPRMWYHKFDSYIPVLGLVRKQVDHYMYYKQVGENLNYVVLYVDDMLLVGKRIEIIKKVKS